MMRFKLTIRRRLLLLFLMLSFLPLLAYRFALDFQHLLLTHQASLHQHTVQNLALILENRPELWGKTREAGQILSHLDLETSSIWLVNQQGQTSYVMGHLTEQPTRTQPFFEWVGFSVIHLMGQVFNPLPYPFPQSRQPEQALIEQALGGKASQQYRTDLNANPVSLMSASPIYRGDQIFGAIVFEQSVNTIFYQNLQAFHRLIGLGTLLLIVVLFGVMLYASSLSNRILRLDQDVQQSFNNRGQLNPEALTSQDRYQDEIGHLRDRIKEMLEKLASYERYLKQLPRTLRHELHNPINRLSATLELMEMEQPQPKINQAKQSLNQLKNIIEALSEASSLEQSLAQQQRQPIKILPRLEAYFSSVLLSQPPGLVKLDNRLTDPSLTVMAEGFLLEQLLDKLIDNALEFNDGREPVRIELRQQKNQLVVEIANSGPLLPPGMEQQIFEGMVSVRAANASQDTHLGLGLYLARLIADFHQAELAAYNWPNQQGVSFRLKLLLHPSG